MVGFVLRRQVVAFGKRPLWVQQILQKLHGSRHCGFLFRSVHGRNFRRQSVLFSALRSFLVEIFPVNKTADKMNCIELFLGATAGILTRGIYCAGGCVLLLFPLQSKYPFAFQSNSSFDLGSA